MTNIRGDAARPKHGGKGPLNGAFATLDDGMAYAKRGGFTEIIERSVRAANGLPNQLVYETRDLILARQVLESSQER